MRTLKPWALALLIHHVHLCTRKSYTMLKYKLKGKKYGDDFLNSYKTNNGPMSFLPINSRCMWRFTRLSSSCFVAHVSSESMRSIVLLIQYSVAQSLWDSWKFAGSVRLGVLGGGCLVSLNGNVFLSSLWET